MKNKIVHRGIYDNRNIPENTIPAFEKAIKKGYAIELDVHRLKDNNIVVFHDDNLMRVAEINKKIKDFSYEELKTIQLFKTDYTIPLLKEVLELVNGKVGLLIELKYNQINGALEKEVCQILDDYQGDFMVQSFYPLSIWRIKKWKPEWIRGQLLSNGIKKYRLIFKILLNNPFTNPHVILPELPLSKEVNIQKIRQKKMVIGWTARNQEEYEEYKKYCNNIIRNEK